MPKSTFAERLCIRISQLLELTMNDRVPDANVFPKIGAYRLGSSTHQRLVLLPFRSSRTIHARKEADAFQRLAGLCLRNLEKMIDGTRYGAIPLCY